MTPWTRDVERGQRLSSTDITGRSARYGYDEASRLTSETITGDTHGASFKGALS
jgi:YD repeat-containing protein